MHRRQKRGTKEEKEGVRLKQRRGIVSALRHMMSDIRWSLALQHGYLQHGIILKENCIMILTVEMLMIEYDI
jgi:hypothetical protein